jgi:hypothetical protein
MYLLPRHGWITRRPCLPLIWSAARSDAQGHELHDKSRRSMRSHSSRGGHRRGARERVRGCGAVWFCGPIPRRGENSWTATSRRAHNDERPSYSVSHSGPNLTCQLSNMETWASIYMGSPLSCKSTKRRCGFDATNVASLSPLMQ